MLRKGRLHVREPDALNDGTFRAVTLINKPPHGVMVWAGRLYAVAGDKNAEDIEIGDYQASEKVSFCQWADVWEYFASREYAALVSDLRSQVQLLYPGE